MVDEGGPGSTGFVRRQPGANRWAMAAFLTSSAVLCPPLPLIGALLGLRALSKARASPGRGGQRLATAAVVVGFAATLAWTAAAWWWNGHVRQPIIHGPSVALAAGFAGDVDGFRSSFHESGQAATDAEAAAFLDELGRRYGRWLDLRPGSSGPGSGPIMKGGRVDCPYELRFEKGSVDAVGRFVIIEPGRGLVGRFDRLEVADPERGPLVYPPD